MPAKPVSPDELCEGDEAFGGDLGRTRTQVRTTPAAPNNLQVAPQLVLVRFLGAAYPTRRETGELRDALWLRRELLRPGIVRRTRARGENRARRSDDLKPPAHRGHAELRWKGIGQPTRLPNPGSSSWAKV